MMEQLPIRVVDWRLVKKSIALNLVVAGALAGVLSFLLWGPLPAIASVGVLLCLALGFWITEMLTGVFTQTRKANPTALLLLFFGKLGWWGALILAARHMPPGFDRPVGLGIGSFLLALLLAMLRHYGMHRISDGNPPSLS
jgi:hypothetical protein